MQERLLGGIDHFLDGESGEKRESAASRRVCAPRGIRARRLLVKGSREDRRRRGCRREHPSARSIEIRPRGVIKNTEWRRR